MTDPVREHFVNLEEFRRQLRRLGGALVGEILVTAATAGALPIRNAAADKAPKRTGTLTRSIHIEVLESGQFFCWVAIGTNLEYAVIHEFGGVIIPKNAKFLAIPVGNLVGSPRLHDLNVAQTRNGQYVLVDQSGQVQYLLRQQVVIPARPYLRPAWDENIDKAVAEMVTVLKQQLERTR